MKYKVIGWLDMICSLPGLVMLPYTAKPALLYGIIAGIFLGMTMFTGAKLVLSKSPSRKTLWLGIGALVTTLFLSWLYISLSIAGMYAGLH
jgi:hypothetical protein